jgi:hypothetical protein
MKIVSFNIAQLIFFISLMQLSFISPAQSTMEKDFQKEKLKFYRENTDTSKAFMLIKRQNNDSIVFSFFEEFNDTVVLFVNKKKQVQLVIDAKDNPVESSGYSGIDYSLHLKKEKNIVIIKLLSQKKYIEFIVDKKYPLYSIQRYGNTWYVNARKYMMILK